ILPYVEQQNLYSRIKWNEDVFWHGTPGAYLNSIRMPSYLCPSNVPKEFVYEVDDAPAVAVAHTNYLGVNGEDQFTFDGILYVNYKVRMAAIEDGTSRTLLVGERPPAYDGYMGWWFAGCGWYPWFGASDIVLGG